MNIVWRPMAEADRENIFDYIAQDNPRAALELDEDFKAKVEIAARNPKLYKVGRVRGTREIVVRPNYVMGFYAGTAEISVTPVSARQPAHPGQ